MIPVSKPTLAATAVAAKNAKTQKALEKSIASASCSRAPALEDVSPIGRSLTDKSDHPPHFASKSIDRYLFQSLQSFVTSEAIYRSSKRCRFSYTAARSRESADRRQETQRSRTARPVNRIS